MRWRLSLPAGCLSVWGLLLRKLFRFTAKHHPIGPGGRHHRSHQLGRGHSLFGMAFHVRAWDLPFSRAVFESVSGWTTTGLSVVDVTQRRSDDPALAQHHATGRRRGAGHHHDVGHRRSHGSRHLERRGKKRSTRSACAAVGASGSDHLYRLRRRRHTGLLDGGHVAFRRGQPFLCRRLHGRVFNPRRKYRILGFRGHRSGDPAAHAARQPQFRYCMVSVGAASSAWLREMARSACMAVLIPLSAAAVFLLTCRTIYPQLGKVNPGRDLRDRIRHHHHGLFNRQLRQLECLSVCLL